MGRIEADHTKRLVFFLHGYGANGENLLSLGHQWREEMPYVSFVAPNAPEPCDGSLGYQWFPVGEQGPEAYLASMKKACAFVDGLLQEEIRRYGLTKEQVILVGFSQGAMMALFTNYVFVSKHVAGVIAYSGCFLPHVVPEALMAGSPLLVIHGDDDTLIPLTDVLSAVEVLDKGGIACDFHHFADLGHSISAQGLSLGKDFIQNTGTF